MKTRWLKPTLIVFMIIMGALTLFAQDNVADSIEAMGTGNSPPAPDDETGVISPLSRLEFSLSLAVLGFGLIILCIEIFLIRARQISPEDTIKFFVITLIIISTLFLITAGYSNDQIAPATGLLGTIAGYLLGRIQNKSQPNEESR